MFEHFEIAAYKSLIAMSEFHDYPVGAAAAHTSLREEEDMAAWLNDHIAPKMITFLERVKAGVTADH